MQFGGSNTYDRCKTKSIDTSELLMSLLLLHSRGVDALPPCILSLLIDFGGQSYRDLG